MRLIIIVLLLSSFNLYSHVEPIGPSKFSGEAFRELEGLPTGTLGELAPFSGRAFVISIGVDFCEKYHILNYAKSDANYFLKSLKKDTGIIELREYVFRDYASDEQVRAAFDEIETTATKYDLFIFYFAGLSKGEAICLTNNEFKFDEILAYSQNIFCQRQLYIYDSCFGDQFADAFTQFVSSKPQEKVFTDVDRILISNESIGYEEGKGANNRDTTFAGGLLTGSIVNSKFPILSIFERRKRYFWDDYKYDLRQSVYNSHNELNLLIFSERDFIKKFIQKSYGGYTKKNPGNNKEFGKDYGKKIVQIPNRGLTESGMETKKDFIIRKGETLAILVGNQNFEMFSRLPNTKNDIERISSILDQQYRTKVIKLQDIEYSAFIDTLLAIRLTHQFEEGSQLLFFAASHGVRSVFKSGYLCFTDSKNDGKFSTSYDLHTLKETISNFGATNTLMLMDICHSSLAFGRNSCKKPTATEIPLNSPIFVTPFNQYSPAYDNFLDKEQSTYLYFGSSRDQTASDGAGSNSPFASVIISFLENNDLPVIDTYHLQKTIETKIMHLGSVSLPTFCSYNTEEHDGRFLFIRKGASR
jgi:hypothetical protein